jgi:hypothetical protein
MPSAPAQNWRVLLRSRRRVIGARVNARMSVFDSAADSDASVSTVSVVHARCARVGMTLSCKEIMSDTETGRQTDRRTHPERQPHAGVHVSPTSVLQFCAARRSQLAAHERAHFRRRHGRCRATDGQLSAEQSAMDGARDPTVATREVRERVAGNKRRSLSLLPLTSASSCASHIAYASPCMSFIRVPCLRLLIIVARPASPAHAVLMRTAARPRSRSGSQTSSPSTLRDSLPPSSS